MNTVNTLLSQRLKKTEHSSKMAAMAKQSASGNLTSFSGIFSVSELSEHEKARLENILKEYSTGNEDLSLDLDTLISITSEVKAINNQAAILHGERIKKAHGILTHYRDGAFTAWLLAAYGNRQTPYNLMQYFDFYEAMPKSLRPQIEAMPRQAVYTLASREGPLEKKRKLVESYNGETKAELLCVIREKFPLAAKDKRRHNAGEATLEALKRMYKQLQKEHRTLTKIQKNAICELLEEMRELIANDAVKK
jgi:Uncharacterised protein family (UPF0137)